MGAVPSGESLLSSQALARLQPELELDSDQGGDTSDWNKRLMQVGENCSFDQVFEIYDLLIYTRCKSRCGS